MAEVTDDGRYRPYSIEPAQLWDGQPRPGFFKISVEGRLIVPELMFPEKEAAAIRDALNEAYWMGQESR